MQKSLSQLQKWAYILIIIVLGYIVLKEAKMILVPLALSLLASYLLFPLVNFFEQKVRLPRSLAILTAILIGVLIFAVITNLLMLQIKVFIKSFPEFKEQAIANFNAWQTMIENKFHLSTEKQDVWLQQQLEMVLDTSGELLKKVLKGSIETIEILLFIPIFTFFMLLYRDRGKEFVLQLAKEKDSKLTEELLHQISQITIKYIVGVFTVVVILAISHSIALSIIGVRNAVALALMAAMFSFIPYFGTLVSGLLPLTFSLVFSSNPYEPLFIAIYFLIITFIDHNILTPSITGGNVSLNPLVTINGLIVAAFIWGIPGMIIIVPLLGVIKIICDNVDELKPYGYILGINHHGVNISKLKKMITKKK